jgi:hypothetical protein
LILKLSIQVAEKEFKFYEALKLIDEYVVSTAMPTIAPKMRQTWISRLTGNLHEAMIKIDK